MIVLMLFTRPVNKPGDLASTFGEILVLYFDAIILSIAALASAAALAAANGSKLLPPGEFVPGLIVFGDSGDETGEDDGGGTEYEYGISQPVMSTPGFGAYTTFEPGVHTDLCPDGSCFPTGSCSQ